MAEKETYRASTYAPVNIAVIKSVYPSRSCATNSIADIHIHS